MSPPAPSATFARETRGTVQVSPSIPAAAAVQGPARPVAVPRLRTSFGWTFAGNAVYAACQWGILATIAQLSSSEAVGRFALGTAITAPIFLFAGLHLRASQATDAAQRFAFADYLGVRLAGMAIALAVTAGLVAVAYEGETALVILAVALSKAVEGVCDGYYGFLQQHERMRPIAISLAGRGLLAVATVGTVLVLGGGVALAALALAGAWLAVLLLHDVRAGGAVLREHGQPRRPRLQWGRARAIVAIAFPLGLVIMLVSLRTNVPRYFLEGSAGARELGVFAALASLVAAGNLVISALGQSATPRLARAHHAGDRPAFVRLVARLLGIAAAVGGLGVAGAVLLGRPVLGVLFGPEYGARADLLAWLAAAGAVAYATSFLGYALTATRRFAVQLPLFGATTLACAALCLALVPRFGATGAAWAWGASLLLELFLISAVLARTLARPAPAR